MLGRKFINREVKVRAEVEPLLGRVVGRVVAKRYFQTQHSVSQDYLVKTRLGRAIAKRPLGIAKRRLGAGLALALTASLAVGIGAPAASAQTEFSPSVRIWVRKLASTNVQFGMSVTASGTTRNVNLDNSYFLYANNQVGAWYNSEWQVVGSSRVGVTGPGSINAVARVRARKLASGNVEFGLELRGLGAAEKNNRQVWAPRARYFLYQATSANVVRYSSDFALRSQAEPCLNGTVFNNPQDKLDLADDCATLLASKDTLEGSSDYLSSWTASSALGSWLGINPIDGFTSEGVTNLILTSNQIGYIKLPGSIPSYIGDLSELEDLSLDDNALTGSIPPELGDLSKLKTLALDRNRLTGVIPPKLGQLSELVYLSLYRNGLTGNIPRELGSLNKLVHAYFDNNSLSGSIPPELGNIEGERNGAEGFTTLHLDHNNLSGTIPSSLGNLTQLDRLFLSYNNLSGSIPSELEKLTFLSELHFEENNLSGIIPLQLGNLATNGRIQTIKFFNARLPGDPPASPSTDNPSLDGCIPLSLKRTNISIFSGGKSWCSS